MVVGGVTQTVAGTVRLRSFERQGFGVEADRGAGVRRAVPTSGVPMTALLAMQEAESGAQEDREARQHGEAMMDELGQLQRALLGLEGPDLVQLARLADRPITAADPRLAAILRAIRVRAGVELARWERAASR